MKELGKLLELLIVGAFVVYIARLLLQLYAYIIGI